MKKTIVVATDFSTSARNAACYAADLAAAIKADILLVHIYTIPVAYGEVAVAISDEDIRQDTEESIHTLRDELDRRSGFGVNIETEIEFGTFYNGLAEICEKVQPFLVILGSQGKTAAERFLFGSHAVYAMKHLAWPTISVPPTASFTSIKKIGLACDLSEVLDKAAISKLTRLVSDLKAELHILYTAKTRVFSAKAIFESGLIKDWFKPFNPEIEFIAGEDIDEGILEFVKNSHIDLVVIIPMHHTLIDKLTHKSHTKQFVLHSPVPVMAISH